MKWIPASQFCDGILHCQNEADELYCNVNLQLNQLKSKNDELGSDNSLKPIAIRNSSSQIMTCFRYQSRNMWTPEFARSCDGVPECFNMEDECDMHCDPIPEFCNSRTFSGSYNCPSNHILPGKKVCNGWVDCVGSDFDERNCPDRFKCHSGDIVSVKTEDVCNFKSDCQDASDENICSKTHFYCKGGFPHFVRRQNIMDGIADCEDGSDECPEEFFDNSLFSSNTFMIKKTFLQVMVWIMGIMAAIGNFAVIVSALCLLQPTSRKNFSQIAVIYNMLVLNLALADFLMGMFLVCLGVQNVAWSGHYCNKDRSWRTGSGCNVLGILSFLSAEVSLASLAVLSTYRIYCVLKPIESRSLKIRTALVFMAATWVIGASIAFSPLFEPFSNYFVTHVWVRSSPYFINDIISKPTLEKLCEAFLIYNPLNESVTRYCSDWQNIIRAVTQLHANTSVVDGFFGYYSRTATCLPKLFLTKNDSSWEFAVGTSFFNLLICLYIVCVYVIICRHKPTKLKPFPAKQTKTLHKRIALLIGTDCACWLPICLVVILRVSGYSISDYVYEFAAIILLPINSAVNPLFHFNSSQHRYDENKTLYCFGKLFKFCKKRRNSEICSDYNKTQALLNQRNTIHLIISTPTESRISENSSVLMPLVSETRV